MVNSILNAVTKQLGTTFGSDYRYYVEDVEQGLTKPCFVTIPLLQLMRSRSPILYNRTFPLVVHYFSDSIKDTKKDCYAKAEEIVECLEYLPFEGGLIRGEDISWQIVDDVLQVFITYKAITKRVVEQELEFETLENAISHS